MPAGPHDALFKATFGQPEIARQELTLVLPAEILEHLDLSTLEVRPGSFIDEELRHAHADLLYALRTKAGGEALVYVLFEHQSTFDARMPLRILRYMVRVWEQWFVERPDGSKMPIILPLVLHHGSAGWQLARPGARDDARHRPRAARGDAALSTALPILSR